MVREYRETLSQQTSSRRRYDHDLRPNNDAKGGTATFGDDVVIAGRSSTMLHSSSLPSDGAVGVVDVIERRMRGRKNRVMRGYEATFGAYVVQVTLEIAREGAPSILSMVGYILPPAGISYVMISATRHDRLGSDTYKRMNLALSQYGVIGLSALRSRGIGLEHGQIGCDARR